MQIQVHNKKNDIFEEGMKNCYFTNYCFSIKKKWTIFVKQSTTTKMELYQLEGERFVIMYMEIDEHDDARIGNG